MIEGDGCTLITIAGNDANTISRRIDTSSGRTTVNTIKFGGITTIMKGKAGAAKDAAVEAGSASTVMSVLNSWYAYRRYHRSRIYMARIYGSEKCEQSSRRCYRTIRKDRISSRQSRKESTEVYSIAYSRW
jgi:hypothetical protein